MNAEPLAVYLHWPFCVAKCPYCDFNSHARKKPDHAEFIDLLDRELTHFAAGTRGQVVGSVFFGGGTPSLIDPDHVGRLVERVRALWPTTADPEVTLEANPGTVEIARFHGFRDAGVNRLSLGVQSLRDESLRVLGRIHDAAQARAALAAALATFPRVSVDLIYGRPGQTPDAWRAELAEAAGLGAGHLSAYQLTVEPGTPFHRDGVPEADEDTAAALFDATQEVLEAAGLPAYEISNHARPGEACRHNLTYWRSGEWIGVGPGAHGRLGTGERTAVRQIRDPDRWAVAVARHGHGTADETVLTATEARDEAVMMGLRLVEGMARPSLLADRLAVLVEEGLIAVDDHRLCATAAGRRRLNGVVAYLLG